MVVSRADAQGSILQMSNVTGSGDLAKHIRDLRDRAVMARRIAEQVSLEEAAKSLRKQAHYLEARAKELEAAAPSL